MISVDSALIGKYVNVEVNDTEVVSFACLEKYFLAKDLKPKTGVIEQWAKNVEERVLEAYRYLEKRSWQRAEIDLKDPQQFAEVLKISTSSDGTAGVWRRFFIEKNCTCNYSKKQIQEHVLNNPSLFSLLHERFLVFLEQMQRGDKEAVEIAVFLKREPIKWKKLLEGNHRTIMSPNLEATILDTAATCLRYRGGPLTALEKVLSAETDCLKQGNCKMSVASDEKDILALAKYGPFTCVDVQGWERSMPRRVIVSLYQSLYHPKLRAAASTVALGCHGGFGTYVVSGQKYRVQSSYLTGDFAMWASGVKFTLVGNSLMHSGMCFPWRFIVKGDDAIHKAPVDVVKQAYLDHGCVVHEPEVGFSFVGLNGTPVCVEIEKIVGKSHARPGDELTNQDRLKDFALPIARLIAARRDDNSFFCLL